MCESELGMRLYPRLSIVLNKDCEIKGIKFQAGDKLRLLYKMLGTISDEKTRSRFTTWRVGTKSGTIYLSEEELLNMWWDVHPKEKIDWLIKLGTTFRVNKDFTLSDGFQDGEVVLVVAIEPQQFGGCIWRISSQRHTVGLFDRSLQSHLENGDLEIMNDGFKENDLKLLRMALASAVGKTVWTNRTLNDIHGEIFTRMCQTLKHSREGEEFCRRIFGRAIRPFSDLQWILSAKQREQLMTLFTSLSGRIQHIEETVEPAEPTTAERLRRLENRLFDIQQAAKEAENNLKEARHIAEQVTALDQFVSAECE